MPAYIKLSTLEYPLHEGDIRKEHPEISEDQTWPNFPCPDTYAEVAPTPMPEFDKNVEAPIPLTPVQIDGVWTHVWGMRELSQEEKDFMAQVLEPGQPRPPVDM